MTAHKIFDGAYLRKMALEGYVVKLELPEIAGRDGSKARLTIMRIAICKRMRCVWMTGVPIRDGSAFHSATIMG